MTACGAFDSWEAADGARVRSADTGNLLLDLGRVRALDLRLDPRYGLTGGEDSLFTRSLTLAGGGDPLRRGRRRRQARARPAGPAGVGAAPRPPLGLHLGAGAH